jgi:hypothetical protein
MACSIGGSGRARGIFHISFSFFSQAATVRENLGKMALLMTKYNMNEAEKKLVNVFLPEIPKCGMGKLLFLYCFSFL